MKNRNLPRQLRVEWIPIRKINLNSHWNFSQFLIEFQGVWQGRNS